MSGVINSTIRATKLSSSQQQHPQQSKRQYSRASHNVAITVLYTVVIHIVAWTGNQVLTLSTAFGYVNNPASQLNQFLLLATYLTSGVNPVIYVMKYNEFRRALRASFTALYRGKLLRGQRISFTTGSAGSGSQSVDTRKSTTPL